MHERCPFKAVSQPGQLHISANNAVTMAKSWWAILSGLATTNFCSVFGVLYSGCDCPRKVDMIFKNTQLIWWGKKVKKKNGKSPDQFPFKTSGEARSSQCVLLISLAHTVFAKETLQKSTGNASIGALKIGLHFGVEAGADDLIGRKPDSYFLLPEN